MFGVLESDEGDGCVWWLAMLLRLGSSKLAGIVILSRSMGKNGSRDVESVVVGFGSRLWRRSGKTRYSCIRPVQRYTSAMVRRCHTGVSSYASG